MARDDGVEQRAALEAAADDSHRSRLSRRPARTAGAFRRSFPRREGARPGEERPRGGPPLPPAPRPRLCGRSPSRAPARGGLDLKSERGPRLLSSDRGGRPSPAGGRVRP